mgnify:CR=1 FL=1
MGAGDEAMKPSDDPRSPFNENYKAKIDWKVEQRYKNNSRTTTTNLEKERIKNPAYDQKIGMLFSEKVSVSLLPKKFHVYARAGAKK